jgi:hypothetical protein
MLALLLGKVHNITPALLQTKKVPQTAKFITWPTNGYEETSSTPTPPPYEP